MAAAAFAIELPENVSYEELRGWLIERTAALLDRRPELLMSHLYRIDVSERAVREILAGADPAEIPALLADLMIERQLQKLKWRRKHTG